MTTLLIALGISLGINLVMFIPAYIFKTDKLTDASYAITFVVVTLWLLLTNPATNATVVLFAMVLAWAARLGVFLFVRIRKMGRDRRFDGMREKFLNFAGFWVLQGVTVWVVLLSATLFFANAPQEVTLIGWIGFAVWLCGLAIEAVADAQKFRFNNNPANKGKWIAEGLWAYSRHPNYFGEILVWCGVFVFTITALVGWEIAVAALSPLYIALLLIFVSGIPKLEKAADERWGSDPAYQTYKKRTSVLVLLPNRKS